jgi:ligand-binding sensor domain-containing protein
VFIQNTTLTGSDHFRYGTPFIQHFTKKDYKAGNKNWSITQDENGFIYVGNSNGFLQYDGFRWNKYSLPSGTILRAVHEHNGRIYCGSLGELGYWEKDENFEMKYTSLTHLLGDYDFGDEEIWWITEIDGHIVFQTFTTTFLYDGAKIEIIVKDKGLIFPPFVVHDRLLLQVLDSGIFEVEDSELSFILGSEIFAGMRIITVLPFYSSSGMLIGTEENGFFLYEHDEFRPWKTTSDQDIIKDHVNRGVKISEDLFAIGTLIGGIYIINSQGEVLNQINKETGLNNNTVLSFCLDLSGNLWVGLDNGIDLIRINSPVYYHTDFSGEIGSVYTAAIYNEDLYLGTNRGVFYTRFDQRSNIQSSSFSIIPGSQGQVWDLSVIDNQLFCGQNNSTFIIQDYNLKKASNIAGGYEIKKYPYNGQYLVQGSYNGLAIYEKQDDNWIYSHFLPGFNRLSKSIEFERENVLWVSHTHKGLYRLELNNDLTEINELRSFSENSKTYLNKLNKRLVFSSDSGFVYYDDIQNTFFSLEDLNQALGDFAVNSHIISTGEDNYWIFREGDCARVVMDEETVKEIDQDILNDLDEFLIPGYEDIYTVDSTYTIIFKRSPVGMFFPSRL